ncbi:cupin domain-containing protein [Roseomonas sp. SSH11]|uniref:Cupin domain-containing protein n=1 Tax=Pararoseomonas baculiformis TaxID=2820812 RepID=A0ABS4A9G8_9PROT|nr:cupin domain-containing protein [Pararoseomonas baculiformis]MBP0443641.1 cupin domain-containing protein [Pararoseomonas baculiformis]
MPDGISQTISQGSGQETSTQPGPGHDWRSKGIRHVAATQKSCDTPETLGMNREVAVSGSRTGSTHLWAGTNRIEPGSQTGPHHHGPLESIIYIISGTAHMRWGDRLEFITEAKAGDFFLVPPYVPHQEINASSTEVLHCALVRSGTEEVVINLPDMAAVETPEWVNVSSATLPTKKPA